MVPRILVPVDGSEYSRDALEHALSTYEHAEFVALHVVDPGTRRWAVSASDRDRPLPIEDWIEEAEDEAEQLLSDAESVADEHGATLRTETQLGYPPDVIVDYTHERDIDHVVLGSHSRSGDETLFLGSVAEAVAKRADCPVTILR